MSNRYTVGEVYYPSFVEPSSIVSSVDLLIIRDDGFYLDFNDSTFKDSGWTTKEQALTEKTEGVWVWTTGWTIPSGNRTYRAIFKDDSGAIYGGSTIQVESLGIQKNTALTNFEFLMVDSSRDPTTGLTVTSERSIDGAAFGACANSATELSDGIYKIDLDASDLNGDVITLRFSATGSVDTFLTIVTVT